MDFLTSDTVKFCHDYYFHHENYKQTEYQSLYYPTNAHNVKNVELLKHIKKHNKIL